MPQRFVLLFFEIAEKIIIRKISDIFSVWNFVERSNYEILQIHCMNEKIV